MESIRICVYDREEEFASRLAVLLSRNGAGKYKVSAFDAVDSMKEQIEKRGFQIFVGDSKAVKTLLQDMEIYVLHLFEQDDQYAELPPYWMQFSKYMGGKEICQRVHQMADCFLQAERNTAKVIAMYSPVGRCGKTQFALSLTNENHTWSYIGFEDYGVIQNPRKTEKDFSVGNSFLYYIKEKNSNKILELLEAEGGVIPSSFSPMDEKKLTEEDWRWIIDVMKSQKLCKGAIFDVGTGVIQDLRWLDMFDFVMVPFLPNEIATQKKEKLQQLLKENGMDLLAEKCIFMNMSKTEEIEEQRERLLNVRTI